MLKYKKAATKTILFIILSLLFFNVIMSSVDVYANPPVNTETEAMKKIKYRSIPHTVNHGDCSYRISRKVKQSKRGNVVVQCGGGTTWFIFKQERDTKNPQKYQPLKYLKYESPTAPKKSEMKSCENYPFVVMHMLRKLGDGNPENDTNYTYPIANNESQSYKYNDSPKSYEAIYGDDVNLYQYNDMDAYYPGIYQPKDDDSIVGMDFSEVNDIISNIINSSNSVANNGRYQNPGQQFEDYQMSGYPLSRILVRELVNKIQKEITSESNYKFQDILTHPFNKSRFDIVKQFLEPFNNKIKEENRNRPDPEKKKLITPNEGLYAFCYDPEEFIKNTSAIRTRTNGYASVVNDYDSKKVSLGKDSSGKDKYIESSISPINGVSEINNISISPGQTAHIKFNHYIYAQRSKKEEKRIKPWLVKDGNSALKINTHQSLVQKDSERGKTFKDKTGVSEDIKNSRSSDWDITDDQTNYKQKVHTSASEHEKKKFKGFDLFTTENNGINELVIKIPYDKIKGEKITLCKQIMADPQSIGFLIHGEGSNKTYSLNKKTPNPNGVGRDKKYTFSSVCVTITKKGGDPIAFHTRTRPIISSDKPGSIYEGDHFAGWSNFDAGKNVKVKIADNEKITVKFRYLAYSPYSGDLLEKAKTQGKIEEIKYLTNINRVPTSNNGSKPFTPLNPKTGNKNIDWYSSTIALKSHKNLFKTTYNYDTLYSRRIPGKGGGELSSANDFESKAEEVIGNKMSPGQEIKICGYAALNIRSLSFLPDTVKSSDKGEGIKFDKRVDNFSNGNAYYSYACVTIIKKGPTVADTMCQNIADTTQDQGNTGVASLVRNISRGQDYWPSINGINRTNPASSVRASIAGGKSGATNSTGFIYARPFDNIQFKHYLCYGFHAVTSSNPGYPTPRTHQSRRAIEYDISSTVNNASAPYLFGETFRDGNSDRVRIDGGGDLDKKESTIDHKSVIDDYYGISIESPTTLNARYNQCEEPEGYGLGPSADGYALPGKQHPCGSASYEVNSKKVGKTIYQHVNFPNNQAWTGRDEGEPGGKENSTNWVKINSCGCHLESIPGPSEKKIPDGYGQRKRISYYYEMDSCREIVENCCSAGYKTETYDCEVCEKTGKKDKNGKEIEKCSTKKDACSREVCIEEEKPSKYEHYGLNGGSASALKDYIASEYTPENERYAGTHGRHNRPEDFNENFKESDDPIKYMRSKKDHNTHIGVKIPYNFRVTYDEKINLPGREADIVYAGEILQSPEVKATVHARPNPDAADQEYATITPRIKTRLLTFTVAPKVEYDSIKNLLTGSVQKYNIDGDKLCGSSFTFVSYDKCKTHDTDWLNNDRYLNSEGKYKGEEERINTPTISVPDVEIGTKFCVAHAIWPADSHGLPYDNQKEVPRNREDLQNMALGNGIESGSTGYWRVSEPVCRTIAKKPTTHVHGGSIEAKGTESSTTSKIIGIGFKQDPSASELTHFGSFTDQNIVSNDKVIGTGSGASFGYYPGIKKLNLPGGNKKDPSVNEHFCEYYSILTINKDCSGFHFGDANIDRNTEIINNLYNRYTGHDSSTSVLDINNIEPCPNDSAIGDCLKSNDTRYILAKNGAKIGKLDIKYKESKNNEYINNTYVIDASGKTININGDICIDSCDDTTVYKGSEEVPQLLIFADNINISGNVKRIDAWLIADKNINTCTKFDESTIQSAISFSNRDGQKCTNQLVINGPVFSRNGRIELNRTAGTYSGNPPDNNDSRILGWPSELNGSRILGQPSGPSFNLNNDGPITPAEIINLRADAYIWAFAQAQRLTQAQVVYRRELPVRY